MKTHSLALLVLVLASSACTRPPRPASLVDANQVREAPAITQARDFAPQQLAHAELLLRQAEEAYEKGAIAKAGILAERAVVAFERAAILTRLATAQRLVDEVDLETKKAAEEQRLLDAEKGRVEADIATIEDLILVVKDAPALTPTPAGDPSREAARLAVARSIIVDARLLCSAARLLDRPLDGLETAQKEVARLEELLTKWPNPAPIDDTMRVRAQCLSLLTLARRTQPSAPADRVLSDLSEVPNMLPMQDDRGIVVVLRGDIQGNPTLGAQVDALASAAKKYPRFPIQLVAHCRARPSNAVLNQAKERAQQVANALENAGIDKNRIELIEAGPHQPMVNEPIPPPQNSKNDRVEVVFVAPSS